MARHAVKVRVLVVLTRIVRVIEALLRAGRAEQCVHVNRSRQSSTGACSPCPVVYIHQIVSFDETLGRFSIQTHHFPIKTHHFSIRDHVSIEIHHLSDCSP